MKPKNPYETTEEIKFTGGDGFCWEFDSDENENNQEEEYGNFLADVYDYKVELYEPYISAIL